MLAAAVAAAASHDSVNTANLVYLVLATVVAAITIVTSIRKTIKRAMQDVVDERIQPHLDSDVKEFAAVKQHIVKVEVQVGELRGELRRSQA